MLKLLRKIIDKVGSYCFQLGRYVYMPPTEKRAIPWFKAQGDKTLRLDYNLSKESVVLDLGGYEGQWASDIFSQYCCSIHIFEPVPCFARNIQIRFRKNPKIKVHEFGLGKETLQTYIGLSNDGSSIFKTCQNSVEIVIKCAADFFRDYEISAIDLLKINIEGGEYDLLEHLIETEFIKNVVNLQIQFHDNVLNAETRMFAIQKNLARTHHLTYQFPFVWENWALNNL
jgi:FkbM family methyltransferase